MEEYYKKEYTDLYEGIIFKVKQINTVDLLNLVMLNIDPDSRKSSNQKELLTQCLQNVIWTKDGQNWYDLIDYEGRSRLPELDTHPSLALDLTYIFKTEVLMPVFYESKTFQNPTKVDTKNKKNQ